MLELISVVMTTCLRQNEEAAGFLVRDIPSVENVAPLPTSVVTSADVSSVPMDPGTAPEDGSDWFRMAAASKVKGFDIAPTLNERCKHSAGPGAFVGAIAPADQLAQRAEDQMGGRGSSTSR